MIVPSKYFLRFHFDKVSIFSLNGLLGKYVDSETAADGRIFSTRCIFRNIYIYMPHTDISLFFFNFKFSKRLDLTVNISQILPMGFILYTCFWWGHCLLLWYRKACVYFRHLLYISPEKRVRSCHLMLPIRRSLL